MAIRARCWWKRVFYLQCRFHGIEHAVLNLWKRKPALGIGIGVGLVGAVALAARYGFRRVPRERIPDDISPAIFATRVAETGFGEMIYHISGAGDPVLFLHGIYLGASSYEWSKVYPHFTLGREVIAPDLIGFGESERPGVTMDATDYCESLVEFLRSTCGDRSPVIVASGLTAGIALLMASRHPERVRRLILLLPTGLKESGKWSAAGMIALAGLPGVNRFVYRNYLSRAPFIRGWLRQVCDGRSLPGERGNRARINHLRPATRRRTRHFRISSRSARFRHRIASGPRASSCERAVAKPCVGLPLLGRGGDLPETEARQVCTGVGLRDSCGAGSARRGDLYHCVGTRRRFWP
jgi:pimeloyl-ACP methyl ester carboxylesterase